MRAVLGGLIGVVLSVGAAGAAECVVAAKPEHSYALAEPMKRSDLIGQRFRVTRTTYRREPVYVEARGATMLLGYEAYEIRGKAGRFTVQREYIPGSPAVVALSGDDKSIKWGGRSRAVQIGDTVVSGPLSGIDLQIISCRG